MNWNCCAWQGYQTGNCIRERVCWTFNDFVSLCPTFVSINRPVNWITVNRIIPLSKVYDTVLICHALNWSDGFSNRHANEARISQSQRLLIRVKIKSLGFMDDRCANKELVWTCLSLQIAWDGNQLGYGINWSNHTLRSWNPFKSVRYEATIRANVLR